MGSLPVSKFTNTRLSESGTELRSQTTLQLDSFTAGLVSTYQPHSAVSSKLHWQNNTLLYVTDLQSCLLQFAEIIHFKSTNTDSVKYLYSIFTYQSLIFSIIIFYHCWHHLHFLVVYKPLKLKHWPYSRETFYDLNVNELLTWNMLFE